MSSQRTRIGTLALGFLLAGLVVVVHLWIIMVGDHGVWAARSHENRWSFRSVPSLRGAIHDRHGAVLAHDEATMQVSLFYARFRLRHPIGAAVHGATAWARLQAGHELTTYGYGRGVLGPEAAARDLLAMPTTAMRRGGLDKAYSATIATAITTLLAGTSGMPRNTVYATLRKDAYSGSGKTCGDALPGFTAADILREYDRILAALRWFDDQLAALPTADRSRGLFAELERLRAASFAEKRVSWIGPDQKTHIGDLFEDIAWPFAEQVPFELAAGLRTGKTSHPGLEVLPSVRRICVEPGGTSLRALLGSVLDVGRGQPDAEWVDRFIDRELEPDWLDAVVPAEATDSDEARQRMQIDAESSFKRMMKRQERRGDSGIEHAFNDALAGRLGMRLVERDSKQREQMMWSNLRVKSGDGVTLSIDSELQRIAETLVRNACADAIAQHEDPKDRELVDAALAIIDARSGDVLAFAGAPLRGPSARQVPGVLWRGNGSLGSVAKPFVLIEQLLCEALGRPHTPLQDFEPCAGTFKYGTKTLRCGHRHWDEGKDPVSALAESCNSFFYQAAVGLGTAGVDRALQRFGLLPSLPLADTAACWQPRVAGFPWRAPRAPEPRDVLPNQAIGYGVEASPLAVARAYAGLATGRLPELGLRLHGNRRAVELTGMAAELELVRRGLIACVERGTADTVRGLADFHVLGKTGTAEVGTRDKENNAWFAGFLPEAGRDGAQLCFCAVIYWVPDGTHGAEAAGGIVADLLAAVKAHPTLRDRYLPQ